MVQKFKCDNMSKVILLNASPRANSNTKIVLEECAREIEKEGVETEIISLRGMKIQSCIACGKCAEKGNCVLPDGLDEIIEKIRQADGFIPAAPVYFGTARGDLMAALQRIGKVSRGGDKFLDWMVGGPIAVARRGGVTLTLQEMLMFFAINNMIVAGSTYWNMVIAGAEGTALEDKEGIETIRLFGRNVAKIIKNNYNVILKPDIVPTQITNLRNIDVTNHFLNTIEAHFRIYPEMNLEEQGDSCVNPLLEKIKKDFPVVDINKIKLSIGESSRALIRRKPYKLLVKNIKNPNLAFVLHLAKIKKVGICIYDTMDYECITLLK